MLSILQGIASFFKTLLDIFVLACQFVANILSIIPQIFTGLLKAITYLFVCIGYLPSFVLTVVSVCIAVAVIHTILNGGKQS